MWFETGRVHWQVLWADSRLETNQQKYENNSKWNMAIWDTFPSSTKCKSCVVNKLFKLQKKTEISCARFWGIWSFFDEFSVGNYLLTQDLEGQNIRNIILVVMDISGRKQLGAMSKSAFKNMGHSKWINIKFSCNNLNTLYKHSSFKVKVGKKANSKEAMIIHIYIK